MLVVFSLIIQSGSLPAGAQQVMMPGVNPADDVVLARTVHSTQLRSEI